MSSSGTPDAARSRVCSPAIYDNPRLYDLIVSSAPEEAFYREEAARREGPVLELACGTGRLAIPLALHGLDVTGLDLSPAMLAAARAKAAAAGAAVHLIEGDMRRFSLPRRFGTIFVAINSLLYLMDLDELRACLGCVRRHLAPGGAFVFDIFNPDPGILARDPAARSPLGGFTDPQHGDVRVEETTEYDAAMQIVRSTLFILAPGQPEIRLAPLNIRHIFPQELVLLLEVCGLRLQERYGDFSRRPFSGDSPHQICICRPA